MKRNDKKGKEYLLGPACNVEKKMVYTLLCFGVALYLYMEMEGLE
jgi:hypothetical protein